MPDFPDDGSPVPVITGNSALVYGRDDNDAFWERKIAEAEAAGGSIEIEMSEIPPVPGVVFCMPSARVAVRKFTIEAAGPVREMRGMVPSWRDEPGRPPAAATSRFRLTVETGAAKATVEM